VRGRHEHKPYGTTAQKTRIQFDLVDFEVAWTFLLADNSVW